MKVADFFAGGGGVTSGIVEVPGCKVVVAVNHDPVALSTHEANHPQTLHLTEDILQLHRVTEKIKHLLPLDVLWASVECTNYSNAKGGLPKDLDSRTLPNCLIHYGKHLSPDYMVVENVKEFLAWGPLKPRYKKDGTIIMRTDKSGKLVPALYPDKKLNGREYMRWVERIKALGYNYEYRLLNAADYGALTNRTRYFGVFWKHGMSMSWPEPTHAKNPQNHNLFGHSSKKWRSCKEAIDLKDMGKSIFNRKKPLVENTLRRIAYGINKFCGNVFIMQYYGNIQAQDANDPVVTITGGDRHAIVQFLTKSFWKNEKIASNVNSPAPAILTKAEDQIITAEKQFLFQYYTRDNAVGNIENPIVTIPGSDKHKLMSIQWVSNGNYDPGVDSKQISLDATFPTVTGQDRIQLVTADKESIFQFLVKQWSGDENVQSMDNPMHTITGSGAASMLSVQFLTKYRGENNTEDLEDPIGTISSSGMHHALCTVENDRLNVITDIKMRFLKVGELKRLQGFPEGYILHGSLRHQKKQIGNAVPRHLARAIIGAIKKCNEPLANVG